MRRSNAVAAVSHRARRGPALDRSRRVEQAGDQPFDVPADTGLVERGADEPPRLLEAAPLGQRDRRRDSLRLGGRQGDLDVDLVRRVEDREGEREDVFVEVARTELANRLQWGDAVAEHLAVEDRAEVATFLGRGNGRPVELVLDDLIAGQTSRGQTRARGAVNDPLKGDRKLGSQVPLVIESIAQ